MKILFSVITTITICLSSIFVLAEDYAYLTPSEGVVISCGESGYEEIGEWKDSSLSGYQSTKTRYSFDPLASLKVTPNAIKKGAVRISVFKLMHENSDDKAQFTVVHNGMTDNAELNFKQGESGWYDLGVFDFGGTNEEYVEMKKSSTDKTARFSAVRFESGILPMENSDITKVVIDAQMLSAAFNTAKSNAVEPNTVNLQMRITGDVTLVTIPAETITSSKSVNPNGVLKIDTDKAVYSLPLSEVVIEDGILNIGINRIPNKSFSNAVSDAIEFTADINGNKINSFNKYIVRTIKNSSSNNLKDTSVVMIKDGIESYAPAHIGAVGMGYNVYADIYSRLNGTYLIIQGNKVYDDLQNHWAKQDIEKLASQMLVKGTEDANFSPDKSISRAEFTALLVRALGIPEQITVDFNDVFDNDWFSGYVGAAKKEGLLNEVPLLNGGFAPENYITREEMCSLIANAIKVGGKYKFTGHTVEELFENFIDKDSISNWSKKAVAIAIDRGIVKGITANSFEPKASATRAQAAIMLKRFVELPRAVGPLDNDNWSMVFNDEFEGESLDWNKWESQNSYSSHIASSRYKENIEVKNGDVRLLTKKEERGGASYTTGNIWTKQFVTKYGYYEARYKYPKSSSQNYNISFWLMKEGDMMKPAYQEVDINEGRMPNILQTGIHGSVDGVRWNKYQKHFVEQDLSEDYHIYGLEWNDKGLIWYFDGKEIRRFINDNIIYDSRVYLSTAIMKSATEQELSDVDGTMMEVDYVRVYQRK